MSKLLEETIAKVRTLSASEQDAAAFALIDYLDHRQEMQLTDEQLAEVRRRLADPHRVLVSYEEARKRFGLPI
ncbi:hypothetical protein [Tardiphaga robiniae]|uniref:Addiction module protein n=1 Tax=Tardiphaga robiniae TaxID=943830 RepID=A0A163YU51_9BRAD|nr:hypothetical protein [Tardiphaga robiniae]KZD22576.1 hypothetical protein A4A58_29155 [Tardiphaga robiniae]